MSTERFSKNIDRAIALKLQFLSRRQDAQLDSDKLEVRAQSEKYWRAVMAISRMMDDDARRGKLPEYREPVTVADCAAAMMLPAMHMVELDEVECMSCREIVNDHDVVDGICTECRVKFAEVEDDEPACDYCGGSGWVSRWTYGYSGGFENLKPCPKCSR